MAEFDGKTVHVTASAGRLVATISGTTVDELRKAVRKVHPDIYQWSITVETANPVTSFGENPLTIRIGDSKALTKNAGTNWFNLIRPLRKYGLVRRLLHRIANVLESI